MTHLGYALKLSEVGEERERDREGEQGMGRASTGVQCKAWTG